MENEEYVAHAQFLHENAFLCDEYNETATSFIIPPGLSMDNITFEFQKIALVAARGECPFYQKAKIAESIHPSVRL